MAITDRSRMPRPTQHQGDSDPSMDEALRRLRAQRSMNRLANRIFDRSGQARARRMLAG